MVVLDTNILIDHLRQRDDKLTHLVEFIEKSPGEKLTVSVISVQELYEGQSTKEEKSHRTMLKTVSLFQVLPYTYEAAKLAGEIARDAADKIGFPDAAIAATAILNDATLFTLNKKDFSGIKSLELVKI